MLEVVMNIGEASKASGVSTKMIRYYETIGLIRRPLRTESGYRVYSEGEVQALRFISHARDVGFSIEQMSNLLALWRDGRRASGKVKTITSAHIESLETKVGSLLSMIAALRHLSDDCHGDDQPECAIIDGFASAISGVRGRRHPRFGRTDINPDRVHAH
jgi:MerR family transcriptional regulator, copper efflux regulator